MKTRILIIEDELAAAKHLSKLLERLDFPVDVLGVCPTISAAVQHLQDQPMPDLVFMDIQLSDGLSFDILAQVTVDCPIIYTTAYDQYALRAFKTTGIDYLLKPISQEEVAQAIAKFQKQQSVVLTEWMIKHIELLQQFRSQQGHGYKQRFLLRKGQQYQPVMTKEIAYFYREELVFARLFNGDSFLVDDSLNQLQKSLDPNSFVRLHRKLLTQITAIDKLKPIKPGQFAVSLQPPYSEPILLSQERSSWLRRFLDDAL